MIPLIRLLILCSLWLSALAGAEQKYRLDAGDRIRIQVYDEQDLTIETRLSEDGVVSYPFLGDIRLQGLTIDEVEALIDQGLRGDYLIRPNVTVSILEYRPFFIDGEVRKPGGFAYQPGLTVSRAIALAQGLTARASKKNILITRGSGENQRELRAEMDTLLQPGDVLTIRRSFF